MLFRRKPFGLIRSVNFSLLLLEIDAYWRRHSRESLVLIAQYSTRVSNEMWIVLQQ